MHVIRYKHDRQVLFIDPRASAQPLPAASVFPAFDPATMELGWTDQTYIPADFDIDAKGRVVKLTREDLVQRGLAALAPHEKLQDGKLALKSEDELAKDGLIDLSALKTQLRQTFSDASFQLRAKLIPDYKLQNAAIGVYDAATVARYRATVEAFRTEVHRLEAEIERANSVSALKRVQPRFPHKISKANS